MLCHPSVMMRRQVVLDVGMCDECCRIAEDLDLWLRHAERTRLSNLPEPLLEYRIHAANTSADCLDRNQEDLKEIFRRTWRNRGLPE